MFDVRMLIMALVAGLGSSPAAALCSGASVHQEFQEADLVVRARLVSQFDTWNDEPDKEYMKQWGEGGLVSLYGLHVIEVFKGSSANRISVFEEHNSGAFYIDIDKDYLLFLNYYRSSSDLPQATKGAMHVRYTCGQSKAWNEVRPKELAALRRIAGTHVSRK